MRKLKIFALLGCMICALFAFAACGNDLAAPTDIVVDIDNKMTWTEVESARAYQIQIKNVETGDVETFSSKQPSYSLSKLAEGDYDIKIMATAGVNNEITSEWSTVLHFQKKYETGCVYELVNNIEYVVTSVGDAKGTVTFDDDYRGKPITSIGENAFKSNRTVEKVILGNNVKSIGANAFYNCIALTEINLPSSLQIIGDAAFNSCAALKSISIPDGVTHVADNLFEFCVSLESVKLPANVKTIGKKAFNNCEALTEIAFPDSLVEMGEKAFNENEALKKVEFGKGLRAIPDYAFYQAKSLETVTIPDGIQIEKLGQYAFSACEKLETIIFPADSILQSIGGYAFYNSKKLTTVDLPDSLINIDAFAFYATALYVPNGGLYYVDDWLIGIEDELRESVVAIKDRKIYSDANFANEIAVIRDNVVGIGANAFYGMPNLDKLYIPEKVRAISDSAFYKCPKLGLIALDKGEPQLRVIGPYAFAYCESLAVLNLNEGLESIEDGAFYFCTTLGDKPKLIPETVTHIGKSAFKATGLWLNSDDASGLVYAGNWMVGFKEEKTATPTLKEGTKGIADYAFYGHTSLISVYNISVASYIGKGAFYQCETLSSVELGFNVKEVADFTFYGCKSLLTIGTPLSLETIGDYAFYTCVWLEGVDLSASNVVSIGDHAFYANLSSKSVQLGDSVKTIGDFAFGGNVSLTSIVIPDSTEYIGERAFTKCATLKEVTLGKNVTTIGDYAFLKCQSLESLVIPSGVRTIGNYAFYKCTSLSSVTFEEGVTSIGDYAFYHVKGARIETEGETDTESAPQPETPIVMGDLFLPASLRNIGKYAFKGWDGHTSLTLNKNLASVGANAFYGNSLMTVYTDALMDEIKWNSRWNSLYRPVVFGCTLSQDGRYVTALTLTEETFLYQEARSGLYDPKREGYTFAGWSATVAGEKKVYTTAELTQLPVGTVLTAEWSEIQTPAPDIPAA